MRDCGAKSWRVQRAIYAKAMRYWRFARPRNPAGHVESPAAICGGRVACGLETSSRPLRRIRRALTGSTCPPDTKAGLTPDTNKHE